MRREISEKTRMCVCVCGRVGEMNTCLLVSPRIDRHIFEKELRDILQSFVIFNFDKQLNQTNRIFLVDESTSEKLIAKLKGRNVLEQVYLY